MSRVDDVEGVQGFGPVQREDTEPPFHADGEAHVFAVDRALIGATWSCARARPGRTGSTSGRSPSS